MTCFSTSQRTSKIKLNCSDNIFNEHYYFDKADLTVSQLDKEKILIEVYDYNHSSKEDYLGVYEFDIQYIYNFKNHTLKNTWIALANPEGEDIAKINGYLKLSISVLNDNDPRIELTPSSIDNSNECIIPSQIKMRYKQISIQIFKGEELPDDSNINKKVNKKCQGYIEALYMGTKLKTKIVDMKNDIIEWNETINLAINLPAVSKQINFIVKDDDLIGTNILGSFSIEVDDILEGKYNSFFYAHVYGASGTKKNEYYTEMNSNSILGSKWKGRILMKILCYETEKPVNNVEKMTDENLIELANRNGRPNMWTLYFKCFQLFYLPFKNEQYCLRISMQENTYSFPMKKAINRNINYYQGGTLQCFTGTNNIEELPDIFIYLINDDNETICFQRIKASHFHLNQDTMILKLIPEPCVGKVKENLMSGLVKIKMMLVNKKKDNLNQIGQEINLTDFENDGSGRNQDKSYDENDLEQVLAHEERHKNDLDDNEIIGLLPKKVIGNYNSKGEEITTYYTLVVNVYMTRHLISGDSDGTSDPYVSITVEDQELKTQVKNNCINGIWNESLNFGDKYFSLEDKSTWPILFVKIMDQDSFSDDFLCYNYIWLSDMACGINDTTTTLKPKWHQLLLAK